MTYETFAAFMHALQENYIEAIEGPAGQEPTLTDYCVTWDGIRGLYPEHMEKWDAEAEAKGES